MAKMGDDKVMKFERRLLKSFQPAACRVLSASTSRISTCDWSGHLQRLDTPELS